LGLFYPDVDCPKARWSKMKQDNRKIGWQASAKIYKEKREQRETKNKFLLTYSALLISFGWVMRFLIYLPLVSIVRAVQSNWSTEYEVEDEHRGLSHSLLGIALSVLVVGLYTVFLKKSVGLFSNMMIIPFGISFLAGSLIHLMQDSTTRSGLRWFYPFTQTSIAGNHSAFNHDDQRPLYLFILLSGFLTVFILIGDSWFWGIGPIFLILSHLMFFKICKTAVTSSAS